MAKSNGWKGKHHSAATKAKISASLKGKNGAAASISRRGTALQQLAAAANQHGGLQSFIAHNSQTARIFAAKGMTTQKIRYQQALGIGHSVKNGVIQGRVRGPLNSLGRQVHQLQMERRVGLDQTTQQYKAGVRQARIDAFKAHAAAGRARVAGRKVSSNLNTMPRKYG